ncbi:MAG TPA: ATP-binding protein [Thermodesulfobacteriota bacterium]|nr:ATP-binding protein [Thermodesulfobacteriota bacterium]
MIGEFEIEGQDFKKAGEASFEIKNRLKKLGLPPDIVRRVATAAYEAELNVVIHAWKGTIQVSFDEECIAVTVSDSGPGIPDIGLAMQEGYTTSPPHVKLLGYGSGMGLPNIKKNSDWIDLTSQVDRGTTLKFKVFLNERKRKQA